jgi:transcriptional regulator NrdR family protein
MKCVQCGKSTKVMTTYNNENGSIRRRRRCLECDYRFTTREKADPPEEQLYPYGIRVDGLPHPCYNRDSEELIED